MLPNLLSRSGAEKIETEVVPEPVKASTENFSLSPLRAPPPLGRLIGGFVFWP